MDFLQPIQIFGVVTQGRADADQWVESFTIEYDNSTENFQTIRSNQQTEMVNQFLLNYGKLKSIKQFLTFFLKRFCLHFKNSYFAV